MMATSHEAGYDQVQKSSDLMMNEMDVDLLTQTGPGTPCGAWMRRYWQPVALSEDLSADKPLAAELLGEELVLFREPGGCPAMIGRYCAHQGVDMIYGRVEPGGLRCMYHGWLFDGCGKLVVDGSWLPDGEKRMSVGQPAYPCAEAGGLIFAYMGPGDPPPLPSLDFLAAPTENLTIVKTRVEDNYLDAIEVDIDGAYAGLGPAVSVDVEATDCGLRILAVSGAGTRRHLMVSQLIFPNAIMLPNAGCSICWHVPIDDRSHRQFLLKLNGDQSEIIRAPSAPGPKVNLRPFLIDALRQEREPSTARGNKLVVFSELIPDDSNPREYVERLARESGTRSR